LKIRDIGHQDLIGRHLPAGLTDKQREVLDLLLEHKTSKQIARALRISPHTVDQRIQFAKDKLGASTRSEAAVAYRRLLETYGQMTYEDSGIALEPDDADVARGTQAPFEELEPRTRNRSDGSLETNESVQPVPQLFDGRYGTLVRLGAIIGIAVLLVLLVLGALATLTQLSQLMV
jgi:DNA-binding CsgD family transcriptional regulator